VGFFWVNTPIITTSDAEGAGTLFRVSTLDLANLPRTPEGKVDFAQDFFGREAFLTVARWCRERSAVNPCSAKRVLDF
jgi:asparaginyl-tRNA synthetase